MGCAGVIREMLENIWDVGRGGRGGCMKRSSLGCFLGLRCAPPLIGQVT